MNIFVIRRWHTAVAHVLKREENRSDTHSPIGMFTDPAWIIKSTV